MSANNMTTENQAFLEIFHGEHENLPADALDNQRVWVFGYGSILWKTGFEYKSKRVGYITGYSRKFWQGNVTHRGSKQKPGRVATLIPQDDNSKEATVWGAAYELVGESMVRKAMEHLYSRECKLGGYIMQNATFYTKNCECEPITTILFRATHESEHYLGSAPEHELASQIVDCEGPSGHNIEYVVLMAMYFQKHIPESKDVHLSELSNFISDILKQRGEKMEKFVRTKYLPKKVHFDKCNKCSANRNQMYVNKINHELMEEENTGKSI